MARKLGSDFGLIIVAAPFILILYILDLVKKYPEYAFLLFSVLLITIVSFIDNRNRNRNLAIQETISICNALTNVHIDVLAIKNRQYIIEGSYGEIINSRYIDELNYFLATVIQPKIQLQLSQSLTHNDMQRYHTLAMRRVII